MLKKLIQFLSTPFPSFLRRIIYRALGAHIATDAKIYPFAVVLTKELTMGPQSKIRPFSLINGLKSLSLGAYAGISNFTVINGNAHLSVGPRAQVGVFVVLDMHDDISIGEMSGIGPSSSLMTHGLHFPTTWGFKKKWAPIKIGHSVWINNNCKIGPGVEIGNNTLVLPNSTVAKNIEGGEIVFDYPLKRLKAPFSVIQSEMSEVQFRELTEEIFRGLCEEFKDRGYSELNRGPYFTQLQKGTKIINISLYDLKNDVPAKGVHVLLGYNLKEELFYDKKIMVIDVRHLLHSEEGFGKYDFIEAYLRSNWGLRVANIRYKDHFTVTPPPFSDQVKGS